ncbi:hypothetical protein LTR08_006426 [Meristemomyces frigidus]|nr:hypothetical protein LTR08_006426 [Meristemomyces frigidus]
MTPEFVSRMLAKPFDVDPISTPVDIEQASFYFKRAFQQQDHVERGYLTRYAVKKMCKDATAKVDVKLDSQFLDSLIHAGDDNKDGRVDKDEFLVILHNVWEATTRMAANQLHAHFSTISDAADEAARTRRDHASNVVALLPWGFGRDKSGAIYDEIENKEVRTSPELLPLGSFTLMAREIASRGVGIIVEADTRWKNALPHDLQQEFRDTLDPVREAALKFTVFHNPKDEASLSDLDEMMTVQRILVESGALLGYSGKKRKEIEKTGLSLDNLRNMQVKCQALARHIRGFVHALTHGSANESAPGAAPLWPSAMTLPNDLKRWRRSRLKTWSWLINRDMNAIWDNVTSAVEGSRNQYAQYAAPIQRSSSSAGSSSRQGPDDRHNALDSDARKAARDYCAGIRLPEATELAYLQAIDRKLVLQNVGFYSEEEKTFITKGSSTPPRTTQGC